eukprot:COSAG01_NODE_2228_length_8130_cov_11.575395_3_plen_148_part_00
MGWGGGPGSSVCTQGCTLRAMALGVQICGGVLLPAAINSPAAANGRGATTVPPSPVQLPPTRHSTPGPGTSGDRACARRAGCVQPRHSGHGPAAACVRLSVITARVDLDGYVVVAAAMRTCQRPRPRPPAATAPAAGCHGSCILDAH